MEMTYYNDLKFYCGLWLSESKRNELMSEGWKPTSWSRDTFYKENKVPAYSSQISNVKYINDEPQGHLNSSTNYITRYYEVKKSDYEQMENKPTLINICRPLRLHNYDGFTDIIQTEQNGIGWTESYQRDFNTYITKHFFIID